MKKLIIFLKTSINRINSLFFWGLKRIGKTHLPDIPNILVEGRGDRVLPNGA